MFYLGFSGIKSIVYLTCTEMRETHHHSTAYHQTVAFQTALSVTPRILPGSSRSGAALQGRTNQEGKVAQAGTALPPQPGHSPTVWGGERGAGQSRVPTARSADPRLPRAKQSQVQGPPRDSSPGPAGDRTTAEVWGQERGRGRAGDWARHRNACGRPQGRTGCPRGCGWASQVGLVRLKPLSGLGALAVFFLTVQANCYFELRKIR